MGALMNKALMNFKKLFGEEGYISNLKQQDLILQNWKEWKNFYNDC